MGTLTIEQLHPDFGARITGVDLGAPLGSETLEEIRHAIDRYANQASDELRCDCAADHVSEQRLLHSASRNQ